MKVIIAGTRTITDFRIVRDAIKDSGWGEQITEVVCGASEEEVEAARRDRRKVNVDILGAMWAIDNGLPVAYFPPDWDNLEAPGAIIRRKYGKPYNAKAGPDRNELMAAYADALILVWDRKSKGSADMLARAEAHKLPVHPRIVGVQP